MIFVSFFFAHLHFLQCFILFSYCTGSSLLYWVPSLVAVQAWAPSLVVVQAWAPSLVAVQAWAPSLVAVQAWAPSLVAVYRLLTALASLLAEHGCSCSTQAQ